MLHICQGNCFCESSGSGFGKAKVLYCYGEVVLQRNLPGTPDEEEEKSPLQLEAQHIQIIQIVVVFLLILAVLVVLLMIRSGVATVERQMKRVSQSLADCPRWESEEELGRRGDGTVNKVFQRKEPPEERDMVDISFEK